MTDLKNLPSLAEIQAESQPAALVCGVYFLFRNAELVYIGQSNNVFQRVGNHCKSIDFDSFSCIEIEAARLDHAEKVFISHFRPPLNKLCDFYSINADKRSHIESHQLRLKRILWKYGISQTQLASRVVQVGLARGNPLSLTGISQIINKNIWPATTPKNQLKEQIEIILKGAGVTENELEALWERDCLHEDAVGLGDEIVSINRFIKRTDRK
jgi:hypothetical protein